MEGPPHESPKRKREESAIQPVRPPVFPLLALRAWMEGGLGWKAGLDGNSCVVLSKASHA